MIGWFDLDPVTRDLTIKAGVRTVMATDGTLINLAPTMHEYLSIDVEFPDPNKEVAYCYYIIKDSAFGSGTNREWVKFEACQTMFTRLATEYQSDIILGPAPAGADFFAGMARFNRDISPTHTWLSQTLAPRPEPNKWHNWNGSGTLEAAPGLMRGVHLFISGGNLVLRRQQSVMGAAGGYGEWGAGKEAWWDGLDEVRGGEIRPNSINGFAVWTSASSPYRKTVQREGTSDNVPPIGAIRAFELTYGASNECSRTDPTNYRSVYSFDVMGWFGRKS